jgi:hypothetical protein
LRAIDSHCVPEDPLQHFIEPMTWGNIYSGMRGRMDKLCVAVHSGPGKFRLNSGASAPRNSGRSIRSQVSGALNGSKKEKQREVINIHVVFRYTELAAWVSPCKS